MWRRPVRMMETRRWYWPASRRGFTPRMLVLSQTRTQTPAYHLLFSPGGKPRQTVKRPRQPQPQPHSHIAAHIRESHRLAVGPHIPCVIKDHAADRKQVNQLIEDEHAILEVQQQTFGSNEHVSLEGAQAVFTAESKSF